MDLSSQQIDHYEEQGYLFLPGCFSSEEVDILKAQLEMEFNEESVRRVKEKDGGAVRSVYGSHAKNPVFRCLTRHPRIACPAMQLLNGGVYVYQFKINAKVAFGGDLWEWHQDYIFWLEEDGLPRPEVTNAVVYLDEVNEFNGPMLLIPGSHKEGVIQVRPDTEVPSEYSDQPGWISNLTADLKYSLDKQTIARLVRRGSITAPKGPSGSVLIFHPNLVHGSAPNMSPFDRAIAIVTYSSVGNLPQRPVRPEFLVTRVYDPIVPVGDEALLDAPAQL